MKIFAIPAILAVLSITGCQFNRISSAMTTSDSTLEQSVNQTFRIMYSDTFNQTALNQLIERYQAKIIDEYPSLRGITIQLPAGTNMQQALNDLKALPGVTIVERDKFQSNQ